MKKKIRIIIDISMTVMLPLLMAYSLIGELFHEITGSLLFILFIIHHILNRKWYGSIPKGKYSAKRIFQTILNAFLLVFMILQPLSGILMSKHLYIFLPDFYVSALARSVHMLFAYWGYVLLCIHAGTHMLPMFTAKKVNGLKRVLYLTTGALSVYGVVAFVKRDFPGYMFGKTMFAFFDYAEPRVYFFIDYIAIMILFMMTGCLLTYVLNMISNRSPIR
ncbi:DUF4405 domain-containing protein [Butyrivibrio sp. LB2008]|uniref:DUF4405 domain-containing protein n=1 Tax=Butyrivibrio sp. LB2008 TaxID=1408305 RepID=UPI00047E1D6A|nr:DUF4405 domain-containing protein [Butyrivibrio sp. LB2008]